MVKGLQRSLSRAPVGRVQAGSSGPGTSKHIITMSSLAITIDGATGVGWGTAVAGDFPEGNIMFQGAVAYVTVTGPTSASLVDTWEGDFGVGTTPADDATITGTDVNLIGSTALAAATAEVSPRTRGTGNTQAIFDNTDGSLEVNISVLIDDADISADGIVCTIDGEIELIYSVVLDD